MDLALPIQQLIKAYLRCLDPIFAEAVNQNMLHSSDHSRSSIKIQTAGGALDVVWQEASHQMKLDTREVTRMPKPMIELDDRYLKRHTKFLRQSVESMLGKALKALEDDTLICIEVHLCKGKIVESTLLIERSGKS